MAEVYDIIVVGGGPAGLSAALYAARGRRRTLLLEKGIFGGQIATTDLVENYPGFPEGISGFDLGQLMHRQAAKYGAQVVLAEVAGAELDKEPKVIKTGEGDFLGRAVILAGGADYRKLGVPGERELTGKGVSYCATCDGPFFKDQVIAVVGGGDSAITEALFLTKFASKVLILHRREQLRAERILQERALAHPQIEVLWNTVVVEVLGGEEVRGLRVRNVKTGEEGTLEVSGVFVSIGLDPNTGYLKGRLPMDEGGHILVNDLMETPIPGVFAAGDIRHHSARQAITAAGDGATAAIAAEGYLSRFD